MKTVQKSLRVPEDVSKTIEQIAHESRRDFSSMANEMLDEATRMRRCPGIVFSDGLAGRHARVESTGLDVWEVINSYLAEDRDWEDFRQAYHWLDEWQLRAALGYYRAYPEEIDFRIARNESWTPERVAREYPALTTTRD